MPPTAPPRTKWTRRLPAAAIVAFSLRAGVTLGQGKPVELDGIALSVKHVLGEYGERPIGHYTTDASIEDAIEAGNRVLERSGASFRLVLTEVVDVRIDERFLDLDERSELAALEGAARADPRSFKWRDDAVNIFVVRSMPAGGTCSFPGHGDAIAINDAQGIPGGGVGWLHEVMHFLSLTHTYECYSSLGCDSSVCTGEAASHDSPRGNVKCPDECLDRENVMSLHGPESREPVLTACQLAEAEYELHDPAGRRGNVLLPGSRGEVFRRGDSNRDGALDMSDAVTILAYLFQGGVAIECEDAADVNDDGVVGMSDAVGVLGYLFRDGSPPRPPFGECGPDPTDDGIGCAAHGACER